MLLIEVRSYTFDQLGFVLERNNHRVQPLAFRIAFAELEHILKSFSLSPPKSGGVIAEDFSKIMIVDLKLGEWLVLLSRLMRI